MPTFDCKDVRRRILGDEPLDGAEVVAHTERCASCAELVSSGARLGHALTAEIDAAPPEAEMATMEAELEQRLQAPMGVAERVRRLSTGGRTTILALGALLGIAFILAASRRVDLSVVPLPRLALNVAVLSGVMFGAGALVLRPLQRAPAPGWSRTLLTWGAVLAPLALASLPAAHQAHPASVAGVAEDLVPRALACFSFGGVFALPVVGLAWLTDRSSFRGRGIAIFALVGAAAFANLVLVLHCPLTAPIHRMAGHATLSVAFFAAALALSAIVGRSRPRR